MNSFFSSFLARNLVLWTFSVLISIKPVYAQKTYPVPYQSAAYPLNTQISPTQLAEFVQVFQFGKFDPKKAIAFRAQLQPLAETNDPFACFLLAKTYDWFEFEMGQKADVPMALKWYRKSAELNYGNAAYSLYEIYFYKRMGLPKNEIEATKWLNKSKELEAGKGKINILLNFARFSDPKGESKNYDSLSTISRKTDAHLQYLHQAYEIDPHDLRLVDYYGDSLYEAKRYNEALLVWKNSDNPSTWQQLGHMYEQGIGTSPNITQALFWYKKMAKMEFEEKKQGIDLISFSRYGKREIYRLLCLKKITIQQAAPVYIAEDYQKYFRYKYTDTVKCDFFSG
jgi:TPR repeat protein